MEKRVGSVRWGIAALLGIGIVINYFDRVNLSMATTPLIKEFHFSNTEIGLLLHFCLGMYEINVGAGSPCLYLSPRQDFADYEI